MNYVNYVENNNFYIVLPEYVEHNKENINFSNFNFDCSQVYPTQMIKSGEQITTGSKTTKNWRNNFPNMKNNHVPNNVEERVNLNLSKTENSNELIDIVNKKYVENKIYMKNVINGDYYNMDQQQILNCLHPYSQTNFEFNYNRNKNSEEYSEHVYHNYSNKENINKEENKKYPEIINTSLIYQEHSALQSTDDNISINKYNCIPSLGKVQNYISNLPKNRISIYDKYIAQIPQDFLLEIWESLKIEEQIHWVGPDFLKNQKDINEKMRAILIDWLVEVNQRFNLTPETLFLTINIIDRLIYKREILRTQLQLVGVAALFIACKYEEILCPDIRDFVYITDKTYSKVEILKMEREILSALNFDVTVPTSLRMFEIIALNFNFNEVEFTYGKYLLESFLIDSKCNRYPPSITSCAVGYIIMKMNNYMNYQDVYKIITCNQKVLKDCAKDLYYFSCNVESTQFKAVHKKYSTSEYYFVATKCMASLGESSSMA